MSVAINPPKTPVTKGSNGIAAATVPNVCKMPGPPAPFVPTPLPNIGRSSLSPKGYSKKVKIQGKPVAIKGATFASQGDIASKGTGGGIVSSNTHGPTKFVGPGALDVKIEGKNVQLLSDPMLNNCGPSGNPPNSATLMGVIQMGGLVVYVGPGQCPVCKEFHKEQLAESPGTTNDAATLIDAMDPRIQAVVTSTRAKNRAMVRAHNAPIDALIAQAENKATKEALRDNKKQMPKDEPFSTMVGVMHCKCERKYADMSGATITEFVGAANSLGMKAPPPSASYAASDRPTQKFPRLKRVTMGLKGNAPNQRQFTRRWQRAFRSKMAKKKGWNLPGQCAAQGAILLLMDDGGLSDAMSEKWYHFKQKEMGAPVEHYKMTDTQGGMEKVTDRKFGHKESVPPCKTCQELLPLFLCTKGKPKCNHP